MLSRDVRFLVRRGSSKVTSLFSQRHDTNEYGILEESLRLDGKRMSTLVAWGLNTWGECGVSSLRPVLPQAEEVAGVAGEAISQLSAGSSHSMVLEKDEGSVFTFGKGSSGELGSGKMDPVFTAARVEHLVGSHHITSIAAGATHSLYLNQEGNLLASGKMAGKHSSAAIWNHYNDDLETASSLDGMDGLGGDDDVAHMLVSQGDVQHYRRADAYGNFVQRYPERSSVVAPQQESSYAPSSSFHFIPFIDHRSRAIELQTSKFMYSEPLRNLMDTSSASKVWNDHMSSDSSWTDSVSLPTLLGGGAGLMGSIVGSGTQDVLNSSQIKSIVSSPVGDTSMAIDISGAPVLIMPLKTKIYAFDSSDVPASWAQSSYPCPIVLKNIMDNGGAIQAAIGEDFYTVLTENGTVVVWWMNEDAPKQQKDAVRTIKKGSRTFYSQGNTTVTVLDLGTPVKQISASLHSICMTDGISVWRVRIPGLFRSSETERIDHLSSTESIRQEMKSSDVGITKVVSGIRSTAVITDAGKLWLWGNIMSESDFIKASHAAEKEGFGHWSYSKPSPDVSTSKKLWAGLGGSQTPREVPGLHGITDIALGKKHALALVV